MDQNQCHSEEVAGARGHGGSDGGLPDSANKGNGTGADACDHQPSHNTWLQS